MYWFGITKVTGVWAGEDQVFCYLVYFMDGEICLVGRLNGAILLQMTQGI